MPLADLDPTATSGPSAREKAGIAIRRWTTASPPATTPPPCNASVTGCNRAATGVLLALVQPAPLPVDPRRHARRVRLGVAFRQVEVSDTRVFEHPGGSGVLRGVIPDNLDMGRPANVEIIFGRHIRRDTPGVFRTAIDRPAVGPDAGGVVLNLFYKHSRIKQYLKDGRAMRIETVINAPRDLGCNARLPNLEALQAKARAANHRILEADVPSRAPSSRAQPLSGSRTRPCPRTGGGPRRYASAILGPWPWPGPVPHCSPPPASQ